VVFFAVADELIDLSHGRGSNHVALPG